MEEFETDSDKAPVLGKTELEQLKERIPFPSCRGIVAVVCSLGFFNVYALKVNLSVTMVAMVNGTYASAGEDLLNTECPAEISNTTNSEEGEFNWDNELQGYLLAAFFYGYLFTQVLGGRLAEMFGSKVLLGGSILACSILTIVTPYAARASPYALMALRIAEGLGEGIAYPTTFVLLSQWAPPDEKSRLGTIIYSGCGSGTVVGMLLPGVVSVSLGWPWAFYIFGIIGCVWFMFFIFLIYDSPSQHPRISPEEAEFIEKSIGPRTIPPIPVKAILTSPAVWGLTLAHFTNSWGGYTLLTCLPKYFHDVLHFDLKSDSFLSALPYIIQWLLILSGGFVADILITRKLLSTTMVRKIFTSGGQLLPAIGLFAVCFLGCDKTAVVAALVIGTGFSGLAQAGYGVNQLDIAPIFSGTLVGMTNTVATVAAMLGPEVVGWLTEDNPSSGQWRIVFFIAFGLYILGTTAFLILGSGVEQDWARYVVNEVDTSGENGTAVHAMGYLNTEGVGDDSDNHAIN